MRPEKAPPFGLVPVEVAKDPRYTTGKALVDLHRKAMRRMARKEATHG